MNTKWISFYSKKNLEYISNEMLEIPFSSNRGFGFDIINLEDKNLEAIFIANRIITEKVIDPDGKVQFVQQTKTDIFNFSIINREDGNHYIWIESPPRSLKLFFEKIEFVVGKSFYISNLNINLNSVYNYLMSNDYINSVVVKELMATNIKLGNGTYADIKLKSLNNVLKELEEYFPLTEKILKSLKLTFQYDNEKINLNISMYGKIECSENFIECIPLILDKSLI